MNNLRKTDTYLHFGNLCSAKETVDGQVLGPLEIEKRYRIGTYAILSGANWGGGEGFLNQECIPNLNFCWFELRHAD